MQFRALFARVCAASALAVCGAVPATSAGAEAWTPSLLWTGARQVAVRCLVQSNTTRDAQVLEDTLCARVRDLAGRGAPYPVKQVTAGDPALIASGTVTLLVHASLERTPQGRTVAFTIRPYRASEGGDIPFGTPPRAIEIRSASVPPALDSALAEALTEILPWQRPSGLVARPL
jgi:hypothetical protein